MQASNNNYEDNNGQFQQLRHSQNANQMPMNAENRSAWPTNMSFASMAQQNVGFNTTNVGHHKHRANYNNGFSQAKAARNQNFVDKHPDLPDILRLINSNYRVLICMRGAPGSGKSYLARAIVDRTMNANYGDHIFTTDDFFIDARTKQYRYDRSRLSQAHEWNQSSVAHRAASGWSPIIIDNTNMKLWEMVPYLREAISNGYLIRIVEPNTPWRIAVGKLAQRNSHGVDQEQIARMLTNYEPGTVKDVLSSMQIFNYDNPEPKLRNLPEIRERPKNAPLEPLSRFPPKEQRPERHFIQGDRYRFNRVEPETEIDLASKLPDLDKKWTPFEQESETFWGQGMAQPNENGVAALKPQRQTSAETNIANMYKILKDRSNTKATAATTSDDTDAAQALKRHKKFCRNENQSFQTIRQICSNIPISLLWDLFEKCNGNGDWTMDIILNEREAMGIQTLDTQEQIDRDNFTCECDGPVVSNEPAESVNAIIESTKPRSVAAQSMRRKQMADTGDEVRKQFNDLFVIPHKHYSEHTQKIRDFRYGTAAPPTATATAATMINDDDDAGAAGGTENDDGQEEHDDIIEMDLGIELVCQLDQNFGSNAFQHGQLKDMKTTVFMPKALGQQLYAIWVESLYHQLEEQRQQSIKEDEEFAKVLHKQEQSEALPQPLAATKPKITDLADIEYAWKAYNTNFNEWKQSRPEDLATKLTKDKLFDIFPNVDRQQLLHVFSAYSNNFKETVEFFKEEIKSDVDNKMLTNGQKLLDHVRLEAETIRPQAVGQNKSRLHRIQEQRQANKLDAEEAKREALKDFEEYRNLAMHHSHLKAECYNKARDSFQRRQSAVAYYYMNIAQLHNSKIDRYNNLAANAIVEVHSYTQQNPDMLDLHYLHAGEAIECLDIYLDQHIKELKEAVRGVKHVFIITGRGLHSAGGFSTIKHRVKCRLRERTLTWAEVNPGLLKVKLQFISVFAKDTGKR